MKKINLLVLIIFLSVVESFSQYTKLFDFNGNVGKKPASSLFFDGTYLYGMTEFGGTDGFGNIFKIKPDGTGYQKLLDFVGANGKYPKGSLISDGTYLYGMTYIGGISNQGVIFKIKPDGTGYANILNFGSGYSPRKPRGSLVSDGTFLYGMTSLGGVSDKGAVFKIKPDGTFYSTILDFNGSNGGDPHGSLIYDGTYLYGVTCSGLAGYFGNVFKIMPNGTGYMNLLYFDYSTSGAFPYGSLISDGTYLYGTTSTGGANNYGTVFKIKTDGTSDTTLLDFDGINGKSPQGSLISDGTYLYGMTNMGGVNNEGTFFRIKVDGTNDSVLLNFNGIINGKNPMYNSFISDGTDFYAMTQFGGTSGIGTLFKIKPDGTAYNKLLDFSGTNGSRPAGALYSDGAYLYGVTTNNGTFGYGTIFKIKPDGTDYTKLMDFDSINGKSPKSELISDGNFLYGTTYSGGNAGSNQGTIFKIKKDGTGYVQLHEFVYTDGANPNGALYFDGIYLYGMALFGGASSHGTIYKIKTDGTGFFKILDFNFPVYGGYPYGSLVSDGFFLYGMTYGGGTASNGVVFKIKPDGSSYNKLLDLGVFPIGSNTYGSLILDGSFLYGMTYGGGTHGQGNIVKIKTDGTSDSAIVNFNGPSTFGGIPIGNSLITDGMYLYGMTTGGSNLFRVKNDGTFYSSLMSFAGPTGFRPEGSLISDGSFLYGITTIGGLDNSGTIFKYAYSPNCFAHYETTYDSTLNVFYLNVDTLTASTTVSYLWDFGDGTTSTLATPTHTYSIDSVFNVCMKTYTSSGDSCSYCHLMGIDSFGNIIRTTGFSINIFNPNIITSVSSSSMLENKIVIYPNPNNGIFNISISTPVKNASVEVYNSLGALVHKQKIINQESVIELSTQPKGLYFVKIVSDNKIVGTRKIIKE